MMGKSETVDVSRHVRAPPGRRFVSIFILGIRRSTVLWILVPISTVTYFQIRYIPLRCTAFDVAQTICHIRIIIRRGGVKVFASRIYLRILFEYSSTSHRNHIRITSKSRVQHKDSKTPSKAGGRALQKRTENATRATVQRMRPTRLMRAAKLLGAHGSYGRRTNSCVTPSHICSWSCRDFRSGTVYGLYLGRCM